MQDPIRTSRPKWRTPGGGTEEYGRPCEPVAVLPLVDGGLGCVPENLGGNVAGGSGDGPGLGDTSVVRALRYPEVDQYRAVGTHHDVRGLQVPMCNICFMDVVENIGQIDGKFVKLFG